MPSSKRVSKKSVAAKRQNEKTIRQAFDEEADKFIFARVKSNYGAGGFAIVLNDGREATGIPRGLFRGNKLRIHIGDVIIVDKCENTSNHHQIVAVLSSDDVKFFKDRQRLSITMYKNEEDEKEDDAFEFAEDSDSDSEEEVDVDKI
jgi:translation initiation factor IF-1